MNLFTAERAAVIGNPLICNYKNFGIETRIGDILATSHGQVWLLIQNDGILVFSSDRKTRYRNDFLRLTIR